MIRLEWRRSWYGIAVIAAIVPGLAACGSDDEARDAAPTSTAYLAALESLCQETLAELDALPPPPELITVEDFAAEAASLLLAEADSARRLQPPRDDGLDDDHRAFVRNTDEQAAAWDSIADAVGDDELADATTRIGELVLGRDELVVEMGAPACVRGGASPSSNPTASTANRPPDEGSDS